MKVRLKILHGAHAGMEFAIPIPHCFIGRDEDCYVRLKSEIVSRRHGVVYVQDGKVLVRDLRSRGGTFVNGQPVQPECELQEGDELRVGPFVFEVHIDRALGGKKDPPVASVKESADRTRVTAQTARSFADRDIAQWLTETEGLTAVRRQDNPQTRRMVFDQTDHALPQTLQPQSPDGTEATDQTHGETVHATAEDKSIKIPGFWCKKPTAASTHDAAENALRILFRGR